MRANPDERKLDCYEPGKWSVREVLGHISDTERVFVFRAMWFARGFEADSFPTLLDRSTPLLSPIAGLARTEAWALQVGGRIVDDFGNLSPVALSLPNGLDIFIAINQYESDKKCKEATDYSCSGAYNMLPSFLYYGASQVDWSLVVPIGP